MRADVSRVLKFNDLKPIKTKKDLQRIIVYINWFRPYIKNLSTKIGQITDRLKNSIIQKKLNHDELKIMGKLFDEIHSQCLLNYPDINKTFEFISDASEEGIGGVLKQENKLLGYFSSKLSSCQKNYTIGEKELLAIISNLRHFKNIIYNGK